MKNGKNKGHKILFMSPHNEYTRVVYTGRKLIKKDTKSCNLPNVFQTILETF